MVYYAPCHLREQEVGRPYHELLNLLLHTAAEQPLGSGSNGSPGLEQKGEKHHLILIDGGYRDACYGDMISVLSPSKNTNNANRLKILEFLG